MFALQLKRGEEEEQRVWAIDRNISIHLRAIHINDSSSSSSKNDVVL